MTKILVVDDEANLLKLYARELKEEGYEVSTACSGREAIECFGRCRPDLIVFDTRLPERADLETAEYFLTMGRDIPVIFNTTCPSYSKGLLSRKADVCVHKSSDLDGLKQAIRDLLSLRRQLDRDAGDSSLPER
jgi:two-component system response regulator (stage 0 sporulation protein F)